MASPWLKFYPTDWQSDPALRVCSLAARGLWQEMLCIMHKAEPYGSLVINGKPVTDKQLAVLVGAPLREVEACSKELGESGVYSRDADGTIYSRRMRRDHAKAEKDRANGKGGGNPNIRAKAPREVNPKPPDKPKRGLTPPLTPPAKGEVNTQTQKPESESERENHHHPSESPAAPVGGQSLISPQAHALAEEFWQAAGFSKETLPPGWCGGALAIQKFLTDGCPMEVVRVAVTAALRKKRDGPPENFAYFVKPIGAAFAQHLAPNPIQPPQAFERNANGNAPRKPTVIDVSDRILADLDTRIAAAEAREAGERASEDPARLLPPGRRN